MTQFVTVDRATLEQMVAELQRMSSACELEGDKHRDGNKWHRLCDDAAKAIGALRAAIANAEPIARMQPVTKTRVGNYLNKHPMGDLTAYRHGFKDGVKWREQL